MTTAELTELAAGEDRVADAGREPAGAPDCECPEFCRLDHDN